MRAASSCLQTVGHERRALAAALLIMTSVGGCLATRGMVEGKGRMVNVQWRALPGLRSRWNRSVPSVVTGKSATLSVTGALQKLETWIVPDTSQHAEIRRSGRAVYPRLLGNPLS